MKCSAIFLSLVCVFSAVAQPGHTNQVLPAAHYDLAECAFRDYMTSGSNYVFCLAFGTDYSRLPKEFLARFEEKVPIVRGEPDAITVVSNKIVLDKITRREAIGLCIRELRVRGDTAEVEVHYFASGTGNSTRLYLVREKGKWSVKEKKNEYVSDAF